MASQGHYMAWSLWAAVCVAAAVVSWRDHHNTSRTIFGSDGRSPMAFLVTSSGFDAQSHAHGFMKKRLDSSEPQVQQQENSHEPTSRWSSASASLVGIGLAVCVATAVRKTAGMRGPTARYGADPAQKRLTDLPGGRDRYEFWKTTNTYGKKLWLQHLNNDLRKDGPKWEQPIKLPIRSYMRHVHNRPTTRTVVKPLPLDDHARACRNKLTTDEDGKLSMEVLMTLAPDDFTETTAVPLMPADVKAAGITVVSKNDGTMEAKGELPEYCSRNKSGIALEQGASPKVPPLGDKEYDEYVDSRCNLKQMALDEGLAKEFAEANPDVICDRSSLLLLASFPTKELDRQLSKVRASPRPCDVLLVNKVKVGSKDVIVLDTIFNQARLNAEYKEYRGLWQRKELSFQGSYLTAFRRLCLGDRDQRVVKVADHKTKPRIAGESAGKFPAYSHFSTYQLGDLTCLTRAHAHAKTSDKKTMEFQTKHFLHRENLTAEDVYMKMLLGGVDVNVVGFHRSGVLKKVIEITKEDLLTKHASLHALASLKIGRAVSVLQEVRDKVLQMKGDGPWVLQHVEGKLLLLNYDTSTQLPLKVEGFDDGVIDIEDMIANKWERLGV